MAMRSMHALRFSSPALRSLHRPLRPQTIVQLSRPASTAATDARSLVTRLKNLLFGASILGSFAFIYLYMTDTRASAHQWLIVPSLRWIYPDAEEAHHAGTSILKALYAANLYPRERQPKTADQGLKVSVFGHDLSNPIGTSAGLDKLAEVPDALLALGGAVVEVGGCTPLPQEGNPKPRVFRLPDQKAIINRYGLNSLGADDMARRLRERVRMFAQREGLGVDDEAERMVLDGEAGVPPGSLTEGKIMCVQIAKGKSTPEGDIDAVKRDYVYCVEKLAKYADVLVVNVSSPNTPGLRTLQAVEPLTQILRGVVEAAQRTERKTKPRVMVKVSPDEDEESQIEGIVEAVWRSGVDGVIVGNTTKRREGLLPDGHQLSWKEQQLLQEQGGYSGPQMFDRTLSLVKRYRNLLDQPPPPPPSPQAVESPSAKADAPPPQTGDEPSSTISEKIESIKESFTGPSDNAERKVIFATGGITNGKQALEILNAGGSVAMIYTSLIYGGVGTVTRIKTEMRHEIEEGSKKK